MTFPILGGNSAVAGGYSIDNSLRFNDDDSPVLSRTLGTPTNNKIYTYSFWIKRANLVNGSCTLLSTYQGSVNSPFTYVGIESSGQLYIQGYDDENTLNTNIATTQLFRDVSAYYNLQIAFDTSQSTASNRVKIYVNGNQVSDFSVTTYPSQNKVLGFNDSSSSTKYIGKFQYTGGNHFDGYFAETYFIDGQQLDASSFGEFDEDSGIWKPISYSGSYGNNGYYLDFENSGSLGADQSGNGNNFTPTNLASTDQTTDTPTNNFATANVLASSGASDIKEGNLILDAGGDILANSTQGFSSGKWYVEIKSTITAGHGNRKWVGIISGDSDYRNPRITSPSYPYIGVGVNLRTGTVYKDATGLALTISTFADGDIASLFYDADNGYLYVAKNGTLENSGNPVNNGSPLDTSLIYNFHFNQDGGGTNNGELFLNFGNAPTGYTISSGNADANGYGNFEYNPVISSTNYLALCTQNLATELSPTIDDGSQYFNTVLYTGNGSTQSITGVGFQPDWTWIKERSSTSGHEVYDSSRGATKFLSPNTIDAEGTNASALTSFDSDGFSVGSGGAVNENSQTYVAWNWKANAGSTSSNTDGDITTTVQKSEISGLSILTWTGNGTASQSLGHGLGVTPKIMFNKNRDTSSTTWQLFGSTIFDRMQFDTGGDDANLPCTFSSTTITLPNLTNNTEFNSSGDNFVSYVFAEIEGYSKFGSYTGNGSTDGTFVYTGFRPSFILTKASSRIEDWAIIDNKRDTYNVNFKFLKPNTSEAENTGVNRCDFTSNGFKWRDLNTKFNQSGETYIYMAFAENPFVSSSGVPVVAR